MNCPDCDRELFSATCPCGWTKPGTSKILWRNTEGPRPEQVECQGRESLAPGLYDCIAKAGEVIQLRRFLEKVAMGELAKAHGQEVKGKEQAALKDLHEGMTRLDPDSLVAFTRRYPWTLN